jgi:hypothetical protein
MINKDQWTILPFSVAKQLPSLRLSPPGVVPQRERRPRWICDYSFYDVNAETLPLAALESMQFGHALDRILRHILLANPHIGPVYLMKVDLADGFYRIDLAPDDAPKLAVVFPTLPGQEPLVAIPLVLPMGWKNSPPIFSTATETVADIANATFSATYVPTTHPLATLAATKDEPTTPAVTTRHLNTIHRDPSLPFGKPTSYVDVFVDDFIALAQGQSNRSTVRNILMHAIDVVFRPLSPSDKSTRREPISVKKLMKGDCSWSTIKTVLGWVIDTVSMTIHLPPHRIERLGEILSQIPRSQKRTSVKKWHRLLGELRSMSLALPGARHLFSHMQHALTTKSKGRIALRKGVHDAISDFQWILNNISTRPTRIAEVVPLRASAVGHHDASGLGAGGAWFPADTLSCRQGYKHAPLLWRLQWPEHIRSQLITEHNPTGTITISDLELAGGLLHLDALAQAFDIRERTVLSKTDNLPTLFWQRKASATTDRVPAHLLRLFGIHQRFYQYVPRHDYLPGGSNKIADDTSRLFELNNIAFLTHFNTTYPQHTSFQLYQPRPEMVSAVISALQQKRSKPESLLAEQKPPIPRGPNGNVSHLTWASIPYSKPSKIRYQSYKSSPYEFEKEALQSKDMPSALEQLKITYGSLAKRSLEWGPKTHA